MKKVKIITINEDGKIENEEPGFFAKVKKVLLSLLSLAVIIAVIYFAIVISAFLLAVLFIGGVGFYLWMRFGRNLFKK